MKHFLLFTSHDEFKKLSFLLLPQLTDILKHDLHFVLTHKKAEETGKKLLHIRWNKILFDLGWSGAGAGPEIH